MGSEIGQDRNVPYRNIGVQATTGSLVYAGHCALKGGHAVNRHASAQAFLKIYDKATAPASTDTPVFTVALPPASAVPFADILGTNGVQFNLGLGIRATTGVADGDNTDPGANDVLVNLSYLKLPNLTT